MYQWPAAPGGNMVLQSDNSGVLSWVSSPAGSISSLVGGPGIEIQSTNQINVDLATNSGLEFSTSDNTGELRIKAHQGVELSANGLAEVRQWFRF